MKFEKRLLQKASNPYAPCVVNIDGQSVCVVAPVGHGECLAFFPPYDKSEVLWDDSGTMNIVNAPGEQNIFFSTRNFFQQFSAAKSYVSLVRYDSAAPEHCVTENVLDMPYLHRFTVVQTSFGRFFAGGTLCRHKENKDDWSTPGGIYAADITGDLMYSAWKPQKLYDGIFKNHGLYSTTWKGKPTVFFSGVEGVFAVIIDSSQPKQWPVEKILDTEVSDIVVYDIDGDGVDELITVEGFHGDWLNVYKETAGGFEKVYRLRTPQGHSLWGGTVCGERVLIAGYCHEDARLIMLRRKAGPGLDFSVETIDEHVGPRNFTVFNSSGSDCILSANWGADEIALYTVKREGASE